MREDDLLDAVREDGDAAGPEEAGTRGSPRGGAGALRGFASRLLIACGGRAPLLLFLALLLIYNLTLKISFSNDITPNIYLPISMVRHASLTLNHFPRLFAAGTPYFVYPYHGGYYSAYGIGAPLFAVPFYLPVLAFREMPSYTSMLYLSKLAAAFYAALSAAVLFASLRRLAGHGRALLIAIIYGLMTPVFCTASQAYWQHSPSLFLSSLAIYCLVRGEDEPRFTALSGLPLGLAVLVRPNDLVAVLPVAAYVLFRKRSQIVRFALWLAPGAALTALYNHISSGAFYTFPIMARMEHFPPAELYKIPEAAGAWNTPFWRGFFGNLISPSRGILITSPILLVAVAGIICALMVRGGNRSRFGYLYACFAAVCALHLVLLSKWTAWVGGESFGNRLFLDSLPFLCVLFVPAFDAFGRLETPILKKALLALLCVLLLLSLAVQLEGIISYDGGSWSLIYDYSQPSLWDIRSSELVFYARNPEPAVPPLIKEITSQPARLTDLRLEAEEGLPLFRFHLSEFSTIAWYLRGPDGRMHCLSNRYHAKGENTLCIAEEGLPRIMEEIGCEGSEEECRESLLSADHVLKVTDPLTGVAKDYVWQHSPPP